MKKYFGLLLMLFVFFNSAFSEGLVHVLCYHTFNESFGSSYKDSFNFTPSEFESQIKAYLSLGFNFIDYDDINAGNISGSNNILLTIDDGDPSVSNIYPFLLEMKINPVLFIPIGMMENTSLTLTPDKLLVYQSMGATIAGHGYNHECINDELYNNHYSDFIQEFEKSKEGLQAIFDIDNPAFAYPYGIYTDESITFCDDTGFINAFTAYQTIYGPVEIPLSDDIKFKIPRYLISRDNLDDIFNCISEYAPTKSNSDEI